MTARAYPGYKTTGVEWPREIPTTWQFWPVKRIATLVYGDALPAEQRDDSGEVPVYGSNGAFGVHREANTSSPTILVGRKGSHGALNWSEVPSFAIDTVYYVDPPHAKCDLKWLYWAFHTANFGTLSQDTGVPGLSRDAAYGVRLPFPSHPEQAAIAALLDRETAKIDALVEEQKRLIDLLKEKRQAVISHAVTKGLNPDAPMKDTGIEWLGQVPEHWECVPVRALFRFVKRQDSDQLEVLSVYRDHGVIYKSSRDDNINKTPLDLSSYQTVNDGDLVVNKMKAWQGSLGVSAIFGITSPDYAVFQPIRTGDGNFFNWLFRCSLLPPVYRSISNGIRPDQWRLEPDRFKELKVPVPPINEQLQIDQHLQEVVGRFQKLSAAAEDAVQLLQERRSAVVSAAVTGKIDVRGLVDAEATA